MTGWPALDRLLDTDPLDGGCALARELLDVYAEVLIRDGDGAAVRYPEVAAHMRSCGPCADDLEGLLQAIKPTDTNSMRDVGTLRP